MIDPRPRSGHTRRECCDQVVGGANVGGEHRVEVVDPDVRRGAPDRKAGVVHEDVDVADLISQPGGLLRVAEVRLNKLGLATGVANAGDDPGAALSVTAQHHYLGAVAGKRRGDCRSDPCGRAGDERPSAEERPVR